MRFEVKGPGAYEAVKHLQLELEARFMGDVPDIVISGGDESATWDCLDFDWQAAEWRAKVRTAFLEGLTAAGYEVTEQ